MKKADKYLAPFIGELFDRLEVPRTPARRAVIVAVLEKVYEDGFVDGHSDPDGPHHTVRALRLSNTIKRAIRLLGKGDK